jgi:glucose-6-phosphate 1-dehydrogenase
MTPPASASSAKPAATLLLVGATGDLSQRMLLPSLAGLYAENLLPQGFHLIGAARRKLSDEAFRAMAKEAIEKYLPRDRQNPDRIAAFLSCLNYVDVDMADSQGFGRAREAMGGAADKDIGVFLSIAPTLFTQAIDALKGSGLAGANVRVGVEKPLGEDLASSRVIDDCLASLFPEERIYRFDHYLGKETVQNLLVLRFGNLLFEPVWNSQFIDHIQITVAETIGLEGRSDYFDGTGSLRDMMQNHMLQLLALVAMEPPGQFEAAAIRDEKVKVLRALRPLRTATAPTHTVIGQYAEGAIGNKRVPTYVEELGHPSPTETFVAVKAHIDNWRWQGVPFYLRTGKRLGARQTEIAVQFKPVPHSMFAGRGGILEANKLRMRLQPQEDFSLAVMARVPGLDRQGIRLEDVALDLSLASVFGNQIRRFAYERLLLDFLECDPTLFVRRDEVEAQWTWIDTIRAAWASAKTPLQPYAAGSWGPDADFGLTEERARWHD